MGKHAIDLIAAGQRNVMVSGEGNKIFALPLEQVVNGIRQPELEMFEIARILSI
jgi:6-phosphofructokinase 1